jgi:choline dehydrogenase
LGSPSTSRKESVSEDRKYLLDTTLREYSSVVLLVLVVTAWHTSGKLKLLLCLHYAYQCTSGTIGAYQAWADAVDDQSYTFENILPYFKKSVAFTPPNYAKRGGPAVAYNSSAYSPSGGPLHVAYWNYYIPVSQYIRQGLIQLGFLENGEIESGSLVGFAQYPATINPQTQIRDSSETSFGQAAIASTGLQIYQQTLANQILFDGQTATGVRVVTAGLSYNLTATQEVILAAGPVRRNHYPLSIDSDHQD